MTGQAFSKNCILDPSCLYIFWRLWACSDIINAGDRLWSAALILIYPRFKFNTILNSEGK
jgi:hypothetical protein